MATKPVVTNRSASVVAAGDVGKKITVTITQSADGYSNGSATLDPTTTVVLGKITGAKPKITGKATVGKKLKAKVGRPTRRGLGSRKSKRGQRRYESAAAGTGFRAGPWDTRLRGCCFPGHRLRNCS